MLTLLDGIDNTCMYSDFSRYVPIIFQSDITDLKREMELERVNPSVPSALGLNWVGVTPTVLKEKDSSPVKGESHTEEQNVVKLSPSRRGLCRKCEGCTREDCGICSGCLKVHSIYRLENEL